MELKVDGTVGVELGLGVGGIGGLVVQVVSEQGRHRLAQSKSS